MAMAAVFLVGQGCFNPPTIMHLRMFEVARDHLRASMEVLGGVVSPVHDAYGKAGLLPSRHRVQMLGLALADDGGGGDRWVRVSDWESGRDGWTPTRQVLDAHREAMLKYANSSSSATRPPWIPPSAPKEALRRARLFLVCGVDLVESFDTPGLWEDQDILRIVRDHGLVVLSRDGGSHLHELVDRSETLSRFRDNIFLAPSDMGGDISSTKIRRAVSQGRSVRYLLHDAVIKYIAENGLYTTGE